MISKTSILNICALLLCCFFGLNQISATDYEWRGEVDSLWNNSANWYNINTATMNDGVPIEIDDNAYFNNNSTRNCLLDTSIIVNQLIIESNFNDTLEFSDSIHFETIDRIDILGGVFDARNSSFIGSRHFKQLIGVFYSSDTLSVDSTLYYSNGYNHNNSVVILNSANIIYTAGKIINDIIVNDSCNFSANISLLGDLLITENSILANQSNSTISALATNNLTMEPNSKAYYSGVFLPSFSSGNLDFTSNVILNPALYNHQIPGGTYGILTIVEDNVAENAVRYHSFVGDVIIKNKLVIDVNVHPLLYSLYDSVNIDLNGYNLTLNSDENGTANIAPLQDKVHLLGDVITEIYLPQTKDQWRQIIAPVKGQTILDLQNSGIVTTGFTGSQYPSLDFTTPTIYDESTRLDGESKDSAFVTGDGISLSTSISNISEASYVYVGTEANLLTFTGELRSGNDTAFLSFTQHSDTPDINGFVQYGWNNIGNPYMCTINWDLVTKNQVNNSYWVYRGDIENFATYTVGGAGTNGATNIIPAGQAFWTVADATGAYVAFSEDDKDVSTNPNIHVSMNENRTFISLSSDVNPYRDEVVFISDTISGKDYNRNYDALKLSSLSTLAPELAIYSDDGIQTSIKSYNFSRSKNVSFRLDLSPGSETNQYKLNLEGFEGIANCVVFEDRELNTFTSISNNEEISIELNEDEPERFFIHFTNHEISEENGKTLPTCFGDTDAQLEIEFNSIFNQEIIVKEENNEIIEVLNSNGVSIIDSLNIGEYYIEFHNLNGCKNHTSTILIENPPKVESNFEGPLQATTKELVVMENLSRNYDSSKWEIIELDTTINSSNLNYSFELEGIYNIKLVVKNTNNCMDSTSAVIDITGSLTGINEYEENNIIVKNLGNGSYIIENTENFSRAILKSIDGKVLNEFHHFQNLINIDLPSKNSIYLLYLYDGKQTKMLKLYSTK